jgi:hypothetical protein
MVAAAKGAGIEFNDSLAGAVENVQKRIDTFGTDSTASISNVAEAADLLTKELEELGQV